MNYTYNCHIIQNIYLLITTFFVILQENKYNNSKDLRQFDEDVKK